MIIHKIICYTPFVAGVKNFCTLKEKLEDGIIGYCHKPTSTENLKLINSLEAHDLLINDLNFVAHQVSRTMPKADTCPHWLRAWTAAIFWDPEAINSEAAKAFFDRDYEGVPELMKKMHLPAAEWLATIHLYGTYDF